LIDDFCFCDIVEQRAELSELQSTRPSEIWLRDLDHFETALEQYEQELLAAEQASTKPKGGRGKARQPIKYAFDDDEDDDMDDFDDDDDDEDFGAKKKKKKPAKKAASSSSASSAELAPLARPEWAINSRAAHQVTLERGRVVVPLVSEASSSSSQSTAMSHLNAMDAWFSKTSAGPKVTKAELKAQAAKEAKKAEAVVDEAELSLAERLALRAKSMPTGSSSFSVLSAISSLKASTASGQTKLKKSNSSKPKKADLSMLCISVLLYYLKRESAGNHCSISKILCRPILGRRLG
jgi:hypothetical protein